MIQTPYYLIDKAALLRNLQRIQQVREQGGARVLLALKCFATWSVFDLMRPYMDGTTSSSLNELRLGHDRFGGESHAYSVAWAEHEMDAVVAHADKVIFNSASQLERFAARCAALPRGLRLNPGISSSSFDLADPARPFSRLGERDPARLAALAQAGLISGVMIHNQCENADFALFDRLLSEVEARYAEVLSQLSWVSLGGGIHFTGEGYPLEAFCARLRQFADRHGVTVYLEPGEAAITRTTTLEVSVLDTLYNGKQLAIVDSSVEAHMLDLLIYRQRARLLPDQGDHEVMICGKSCLAGDVFGEFRFDRPLQVGDRLSIQDAGGYTMVKKNWFNGVRMPSIAIRELDGSVRLQREFSHAEYVASLS